MVRDLNTPTGLVENPVSSNSDSNLGQTEKQRVSHSGAAQTGNDQQAPANFDDDLAVIIATWPTLPEHDRRTIRGIVTNATASASRTPFALPAERGRAKGPDEPSERRNDNT
jgi:hypothetical protein